ncbi:MAG: LysR family transcriptional regulator [Pseudolabrys sp.]|jgi:DNA-binding transcriptional LysR family regulator
MDLRHTRTFVTVAELGTVSKAALHLRIAQPALSRQIRDLEQELGLKLFDRVGRRLLLTSEGEQLLSDCRGLLNYAGAVGERAQELRRGDTGVLKVAASPQHIESVFSQFLPRYAQRFPNVQVKVSEGSGREILAMLERGEIHLAQNLLHAVQLDTQRFAIQPLEPVELLAACHPRLTLGARGTVEVAHIAPHPLLLLDNGYGFRRAFDAACRLAGVAPKVRFESHAPHTLLALAEAGHGVAIIPSALQTHRYALRIFGVTYRGKPLREPLSILWDKRRPLPRYATTFCAMWTDHVREVFPISRPSKPKTAATPKQSAARRAG